MASWDSVYNEIRRTLAESESNLLITAPGGVGKSFALRKLAKEIRDVGFVVHITAATGIAAVNLSDGGITATTLHRWAGCNLGEESISALHTKVCKNKAVLRTWVTTDILIIDEISMVAGKFFNKLEPLARLIRQNDEPFGGIRIIASGDFMQLPPVNDYWVFSTPAWKRMNWVTFTLTQPMRFGMSDTGLKWFHLLSRVRMGEQTPEDVATLRERHDAYKQGKHIGPIVPTLLYSRRADVHSENLKELGKLKGDIVFFEAEDDYAQYSDHLRDALDEMISPLIGLKPGAQVMLRVNLDVQAGLANGSRGVVVSALKTEGINTVQVLWLNGLTTTVDPYPFPIVEKTKILATRFQIPLILAWASTIHKAQGSTLDYAICDLGNSIFEAGQLYVSLSRVKTIEGLFLKEFDPSRIIVDPHAKEYENKLRQPKGDE